MNTVLRSGLVLLASAFWVGAWAQAQPRTVPIEIRVTDSQGSPAASARIAPVWRVLNGKMEPGTPPNFVFTSDAQGIARGDQMIGRFPIVLMAVDAAGTAGGVTVIREEADLGKPISIRLAPMRSTQIGVQIEGWTHAQPPQASGTILLAEERVPVVSLGMTGTTTVMLPPGSYALSVFSFDAARAEPHAFMVPAGREPMSPVTVKLEMAPLAKAMGQAPPPMTVTESIGLPPNFKFSDLQGKWVLVEVWGFW
jgi:hypothetical protein